MFLSFRDLRQFCEGAAKKHEIHHMDLKTARIGRETLPVAPSTLSTPSLLQHHDEEGVVHPLDMRIVKVTCIKLSS
jgi:hypothetical protein